MFVIFFLFYIENVHFIFLFFLLLLLFQWLNVSSNHLQWFDYAFIPKSVLWLSLRKNKIEEMGNYYKMEGFRLTHLDLGHNLLTRLDRQALQPSLKEVREITCLISLIIT